ncbi:MAG: TlpA family protein disulfide reductase [Deltaproteobacteria bacterium]|jgi:peroxiredoxin
MRPISREDVVAALVVLALGAPLAYMLASAFADGETRRREAPLRSLLGDSAYEALVRGRPSDVHYLGNDRLVPDFELRDQDGQTFRMSEARGRVVVLNFWTVTCAPCIEEMPSLVDLSRIVAERDDIELVTISTDRTWEEVRTVIPEGTPLRVLLDPDRSVVRGRFGTRMFPETWVVDRRGVIRLRVDGPRPWSSAIAVDALESFL